MALDSKQKRGSAIGMTLPFRQWLTGPTGTLSVGPRVSLLKLCSANPPAGVVFDTTVRFEWRLPPDPREWKLSPNVREWDMPEA